MIAYIALFSALSSRLTALACDSTWVTSFFIARFFEYPPRWNTGRHKLTTSNIALVSMTVCTVIGKRLHTLFSHPTLEEPQPRNAKERRNRSSWIIWSLYFDERSIAWFLANIFRADDWTGVSRFGGADGKTLGWYKQADLGSNRFGSPFSPNLRFIDTDCEQRL